MKLLISLSLITVSLIGAFAFSQMQRSNLLSQQIANYERQNSKLLSQIENNSLKNIAATNALRSLQSELNDRDSRLASLSRQLETAQQQADPDYQQIEARIRQQIDREILASNGARNSDQRISLLKQLSQLDPMTMGELLTVNAQYGEFIQSLDVSDERLEVVINALQNMVADQNQATSELMLEYRSDPEAIIRGDLHQQMQEISSAESQREALSYDLTEAELEAYAAYQEKRRNSMPSFSIVGEAIGGPIEEAAFFNGELIQNGSGQSAAVQIFSVGPDN